MALEYYDRVKEISTTTGTGAYTLAGTPSGLTNFRTFGSVLADGDLCYYAVDLPGQNGFEVGRGTIGGSGTTLARTTVLASSNSNNAVNWGAGTKLIVLTAVAANFSGGWEFLASGTASSSASIDFTSVITDLYDIYRVELFNVAPAADDRLVIRTSSNNGSSYDSGGSDYLSSYDSLISGFRVVSAAVGSSILMTAFPAESSTLSPAFGYVEIYQPSASGRRPSLFSQIAYEDVTNSLLYLTPTVGYRLNTTAVNAIRFMGETQNLTTGTFILYGRRK